MPELPEVETVRQILITAGIVNQTIQKVEVHNPNLIKEIKPSDFVNLLIGQTIHQIDRKGKWLFFILDTHVLISHLGMAGKYFLEEKLMNTEQKLALGLIFHLSNRKKLFHCDHRRFGNFRLQVLTEYKQLKPYQNIGLDLLNEPVSRQYLFDCFQKRKVAIKTVLLEQDIISGIGNIYASEILFRTKIHPLKKTNQLTLKEVEKILTAAQSILKEALQEKGTSKFDFINPLAQPGSYQTKLKVYGREEKSCFECGTRIKRIGTQRSSFFCPNCQKI
ncbi:MAG: DNA-formamidopyrimidine glycosylase [Candidatus Moeniiplasma glomeromycotorum]|nr:DNA-formamidopyrimidine glycosylase [Candidatus Moeniiplasma glomeromycotorum]MCE8167254.1 DNA-formamidopyrimidine glycosylase [Candidatus Moeniiplasma glomeromycotorum]MCE8168733.1 DNA-formamidopyrimidine glycosylase [Candidatus Moeniiplasma glomeromycotorum]